MSQNTDTDTDGIELLLHSRNDGIEVEVYDPDTGAAETISHPSVNSGLTNLTEHAENSGYKLSIRDLDTDIEQSK